MPDPVALTMKNTPFHVLILNPDLYSRNHLYVDTTILSYCQTCLPDRIPSTIIAREIGNDSLYLENTIDAIPWRIEAEKDIFVNYRNPYYNYPSVSSAYSDFTYYPSSNVNIVMSKDGSFDISNFFPSIFRSNSTFNVNPSQPISGPFQYQPGNMSLCCQNFKNMRQVNSFVNIPRINSSYLSVFPNPLVQGSATIKYRFKNNGNVKMDIFDVLGRNIVSRDMPFADNTQECYYLLHLIMPSGMYIINLNNGTEQQTTRMVVENKQ